MPSNAENATEYLKAKLGADEGTGDWFTVDQERINAFADVTIDHQFIHVDPDKAAAMSPFGTTIAHGFLTLSMLTHLISSIPQDPKAYEGIAMGVNYGFDKVRFINPVKVDQRIRATSAVSNVDLKDANTVNVTRTVTVEIDGEAKPALVADWITRLVFT